MVLFLLIIAFASDNHIPADIERYLLAEEQAYKQAIDQITADLERLKTLENESQKGFYAKEIEALEQQLKATVSDNSPRIHLPAVPKPQDIGLVTSIKVVKILGPKSVLAERLGESLTELKRSPNRSGDALPLIVLRGIETRRMRLGEVHELDQVFGVMAFTKIEGKKVPAAALLDIDEWREKFEQSRADLKAKESARSLKPASSGSPGASAR